MRKPTALWLAALTIVIGWFFHESLFRHHSLVPTDLLHQIVLPFGADIKRIEVQNHYAFDCLTADYPFAVFWEQAVKSGEWPLWNPLVLGGHPYLAGNAQTALNPFRLFGLIVAPERAMTLGFVTEFLLAAWFMFGFLRQIGRSGAAAFLGSCAFALNSAFVLWYWRVPSTFVWAPLILWLYERWRQHGSLRALLLAAVVWGLAGLSGNLQAFAHLGFLCALYVLATAPWREQRPRALAAATLLFGVALLVAAIQILPTLELMREGASKAFHKERLLQPGVKHTVLGLPLLITFVFPGLPGSPKTFDLLKIIGATMGDFTGYIGLVPVVLAGLGFATKRDHRLRALGIAAVGVLVVVFFTPWLTLVYHRFFIVLVFALAVAAAYGLDAILELPRAHLRRFWLGTIVLVGIVGLALGLAQLVIHFNYDTLLRKGQDYILRAAGKTVFANQSQWLLNRVPGFLDHYRLTNPTFWVPLMTLLAAGWMARRYADNRCSRALFCGVLLFGTVVDLTVLGRRWLPQVDLHRYPLNPPIALLDIPRHDPDRFRVHQWVPGQWWILPNSLLTSWGLASIGANESLTPPNLSALNVTPNDQFTTLLDVQNVKYVITAASVTLPAPRFEFLAEQGGVRLFRNTTCLPRIWLAPATRVIPDRADLYRTLTAPDFDAHREVLLEEPAPASGGTGTVHITHYGNQRVAATVHCEQPALVVLADIHYPGWNAYVDQQPARLYRANYVLRAVAVPAGEHELEFRYEPRSFRVGALISGTTIGVVLLACIGFTWCRRRQPV